MEVVAISPRGYCYGVVDALAAVQRVARDPRVPRPIHVLGMIVHNARVVSDLQRLGVTTLDGPDRSALLQRVESGTVIFTAHGVSPEVRRQAEAGGLHCVDATCPEVMHAHRIIAEKVADGCTIVYVGRRGHPESEGAAGVAPGHVHVVEGPRDVADLPDTLARVAVVTQTTLSQWDAAQTIAACVARFPHAEVFNEICQATQVRQQAVADQGADCDLVLVVGDVRSHNAGRLVAVAREVAGRPAHLVDSVRDIRPEWLRGVRRVGVTSGASTPSQLTDQVIRYLRSFGDAVEPPPLPEVAEIALPGASRMGRAGGGA